MSFRSAGTYRRPHRRLTGALKVGATCVTATRLVEIVPVADQGLFAARLKATVGGTLSVHFIGPDSDTEQGTIGTEYTTGNPTDVTVTANTEAIILPSTNGEEYAAVIFTPSGSGTITYVDICGID